MPVAPKASLSERDLADADRRLAETDRLLEAVYPGDDATRQPVHTVYVPADTYTVDLPVRWGEEAHAAVQARGGIDALAEIAGIDAAIVADVGPRAKAKLDSEPIEDLRLDFEDGYGDRGDAVEDGDAVRAARHVIDATEQGTAPAFIGIRFKCLEAPTRARGIRTLDLFVSTLAESGELPDGLVLTLPKVSTVAQVEVMADLVERLETVHGLTAGRLRFEVQVETPQLILGATGRSPLAELPSAVPGRVSSLHYGTYDYSASLGIAAQYQSMEHPAADHAKAIMQLAVAGTGIRLSDGSTNVLPIGADADAAWALHARLVRRSLEAGIYQGWDLHAAQLPTRYLANYAFYREGYAAASARLHRYLARMPGAVLDEPATARALAGFVLRGVQCGAISSAEVRADIDIEPAALAALAHPAAHSSRPSETTKEHQ